MHGTPVTKSVDI